MGRGQSRRQSLYRSRRAHEDGLQHDVPLSDAAVDLLREQLVARRPKQTHVFPGRSPGKPLSNPALGQTMRRMGGGAYTVHGFRSAFRD
jgi:integrase